MVLSIAETMGLSPTFPPATFVGDGTALLERQLQQQQHLAAAMHAAQQPQQMVRILTCKALLNSYFGFSFVVAYFCCSLFFRVNICVPIV